MYRIAIKAASNNAARFRWAIFRDTDLKPIAKSERSHESQEAATRAAQRVLNQIEAGN